MNDTVIRVENVGKKYCRTLKHSMLWGAADLARSFVGFSPNSDHLREGEFWSLEGVNFELKRGECLGLIGPNGAGKSTLLKILNGIILPDKGAVEISGRSGALIEVGAGFHPLLTGRENIYVNGAILGLTRREITSKLDEIIEFSGLEEFIDMPVRHYSSGMYVRLGFAVAAHTEPDVLLIDEILAVGDAGFRAKCYNWIGRLAERAAVVFVSHSMPAISRLSTSTMVIDRGSVVFQGATADAITRYNRLFEAGLVPSRHGDGSARIQSVTFLDESGRATTQFRLGQRLVVELRIRAEEAISDACVDLVFIGLNDEVVAECNSRVVSELFSVAAGEDLVVSATIESLTLNGGIYKVSALFLSADMVTHYDWCKDVASIEVSAGQVGVAGQQFLATWNSRKGSS